MTLGHGLSGDSFAETVRAITAVPGEVVVQVRNILPGLARTAEALVFPKNAELRRKATTHPLTEMPNGETIASLVKEKFGDNTEIFVFYIDSDGLKKINDQYGHTIGDEYLKSIAQRLKQIDGLAFHLHGDEFVVILEVKRAIAREEDHRREDHLTDPDGFAERVVNFIRESVEHTALITGKDGLIEVPVEISIGYVRCADSQMKTIETAMERADEAMYHDKAHGRAKRSQLDVDAEIDMFTGKREFLLIYHSPSSYGELVRKLTNKLVTDVENLDRHYSPDVRKNIPASAYNDLIDSLKDMGCDDAARYIEGLTKGEPLFIEDNLSLGDTGLTRGQVREISRAFNK